MRRRTILATTIALLAACTSADPATIGPTSSSASTSASPSAASDTPWIAYQWAFDVSEQVYTNAVFLVRADGTENHLLIPNVAARSEVFDPDWSPDGTQVALSVARGDRNDLWIADVDGTDAHRLVACSLPCNTMSKPDWSPDGRQILFGEDSFPLDENGIPSRFEVNVLDVESGKVTTVLAREDGLTAESARWSPDGSRIVFVRSRLERAGEWGSALFIAEVATGSERRLTDWNLSAVYPDWGTDGRIVFSTYDLALFPQVERAGNLYTIAPDGSDLRAVTTFASAATVATQPRWTADGVSVIFTQVTRTVSGDPGTRTMTLIDPDGSDLRPATPDSLDGTHPTMQPTP